MGQARSILLLGYGNPGREDDGLGPAVIDAFERDPIPGVNAQWEFQPTVEHAAEIARFDEVIFVDASEVGSAPYSFRELLGRDSDSFSTHAIRPEAVVALACSMFGWHGRAFIMGVRGYSFRMFVEGVSPTGAANVSYAVGDLRRALSSADLPALITDVPTDRTGRVEGGEACQPANL